MRTTVRLTLALVLSAPALAHAYCYSIYDTNNHLSFQSTVAPIDLSQPDGTSRLESEQLLVTDSPNLSEATPLCAIDERSSSW